MNFDTASLANPRGLFRAIRSALGMLRPPPNLKPSEWAEKNIQIPAGNAIPGPLRFDNAPYQREPMDMAVHPDCRRVTLMWGAQVGKTTCALGIQGYFIAMQPRSQMLMQPSQGDLKTWLETKFNPLAEASEAIGRVLAKPRGREGVNNQQMKSYPGGFLMFAWSGSPKTMRGRSAPIIVCDEVDGYDRTNEGHPVGLLWQRAATFKDQRFLLEISTPTIKDISYIEKAFLAGDQRHFHVICPDCGEHQALHWSNVTWTGRRSANADEYEKDREDLDAHEPDTARYACAHCGTLWNDGQRVAAIRTAEANGAGWKASRPFRGHASYHLWEAYSCFRRLADIVRDYIDKLKADDIQTFVNVSLSQTFEVKGEVADAEGLMARRESFGETLPDGVQFITLGSDMQEDRLEYEIVGWGVGEESWSLGYGVLWGDPLAGAVFDDLESVIQHTTFKRKDGSTQGIAAACLDTGGSTGYPQAAWEWLRGKTGRRIFGVKGYAPSWGAPIVTAPQRRKSGKHARKVDIFNVAVDEAKLVIMRRLAVEKPGPGFAHFPNDDAHGEEYFRQLTAEKLVTTIMASGAGYREWVKTRKRNEALDCRVYAYAALKIMNPRIRGTEIPHLEPAPAKPETAPVPQQAQPAVIRTGRRKWRPQ